MEEVRKYMTKLSQIIGRTAGVLDPNGRIVASTTPALVGEEDVAGVSANVTTETIASTSSRSYIRLEPVEQGEFIAFIDGRRRDIADVPESDSTVVERCV